MKKLTFITREYNDLDHALPIIYFLKKSNKYDIKIYSIGNNLDRNNSLNKILRDEINIKIEKFEQIYNKNFFFKLAQILKKKKETFRLSYKKTNMPLIIFIELLNQFLNILVILIHKKKILSKLLNSTVLADFGTEDLFPYNSIIKLSKKYKIPIYAYAHGVNIFANLDPIRKKTSKSYLKNLLLKILFFKFNPQHYDKYLVGIEQTTYFRSTMYKSFNRNYLHKIYEIGIPRYTKEWIEVLDKYYYKNYNNKNLINVCLFLSNEKFNVNKTKLKKLVVELSKLKNIKFSIKGHTRSGLTGLHKGIDKKFIIEKESNDIILNTDIAIIYGTSITFQALQKKVPVIIPSYIDNNEHIFTKYNTCFNALSQQEVIDFIENFDKQKFLIEKQKNIEKFINKIVYDNKNYDNMMKRYHDILIYEK